MRLSTQQLKTIASTHYPRHFTRMLKEIPGRINIVAEGDSWFDYPRKYVLSGAPSNVVDHIQRRTKRRANLLRLECNGDEALEILSGDQKSRLCSVLEGAVELGNPVDLLLFSGGGNDVAGRYRLDLVLKPNASRATTASECFLAGKLRERIKQLELAYKELIHLCARYSPETVIVTHTYDRPFPDGRPAKFLKVIRRGPWLKDLLVAAGVPKRLHRPATSYLIDEFATMVTGLAPKSGGRLVVADTRGTLTKNKWKDEMHPNSGGFGELAKKVFTEMRKVCPELPDWKDKTR